jgi:hypothetical protein
MHALQALTCGMVVLLLTQRGPAEEPRPDSIRPSFTVARDTTRIIEPLTADGWPDYFAALNEQLAADVTVENNAAVLLYRALGPTPGGDELPPRFYELLGVPTPAIDGDYFVGFEAYLARTLPLGEADPQYSVALEHLSEAVARPWTAEQHRLIAGWLSANERPLAIITEGAARSGYYRPLVPAADSPGLISAPLSGVQQYRGMARALCARALLRTATGDVESGWRDLLTCHRLARLCGRGATLIEGLVAIAIDGSAVTADLAFLEHSRPDAETIRQYLADLDRLPPLPSIVDKIDRGERFLFLDSVLLIARGDEDAMQLLNSDTAGGRLMSRLALNAIDWDVVLRMGNDAFDRIVAALRKPDRRERNSAAAAALNNIEQLLGQARDPEALQKLAADAKDPREAVSQLVARAMLSLLLPAVTQVVVAEDRAEQRVRNLRVAMALAAWRAKNGQYPERLDELSQGGLIDPPLDVFTERPLVYRRETRGYVLYSLGPNETDDGGHDATTGRTSDDLAIRMR